MKTIGIRFNEQLEKQLDFIIEIDKVKSIIRKSKLFVRRIYMEKV